MEKISLVKIKCIIWDLDGTLWKQKKSTEKDDEIIVISNAEKLIRLSTEYGIINSICSYNLQSEVFQILEEKKLLDFFVFPSINYSPKGNRIKQIINNMSLTPDSVLFIDDELQNLREAQYYNEGLNVCTPFIIEEFLSLLNSGVFQKKNRLASYKLLEEKQKQKEISCLDNEEFLKYSNINVFIKKINNFSDINNFEFDRIYELANRTNQLNFTKNRYTKEQLKAVIKNSSHFGLINVSDRFGNYGYVGFYNLDNDNLIDFVFSCRIMNMGVEQFVYQYLKEPNITIKGTVASDLQSPSYWVHMKNCEINERNEKTGLKILFKGSCDFKRMRIFLPENIMFEVQYEQDGKTIVYQTGIPAMVMTCKYDLKKIIQYTKDLPFFSELYYKTELFSGDYDIVFLSLISLGNLGVYKHKHDDFFIGMGIPDKPMHLLEYQSDYATDGIYSNGFDNREYNFDYLRANFDYINDIYCKKYLIEHLGLIIRNINAKKIYLVLGNEEKYKKELEKSSAGKFFSEVNQLIYKSYEDGVFDKLKVNILNISEFIKSENDVMNHFNHFTSSVYYNLARAMDLEIKKWEK